MIAAVLVVTTQTVPKILQSRGGHTEGWEGEGWEGEGGWRTPEDRVRVRDCRRSPCTGGYFRQRSHDGDTGRDGNDAGSPGRVSMSLGNTEGRRTLDPKELGGRGRDFVLPTER